MYTALHVNVQQFWTRYTTTLASNGNPLVSVECVMTPGKVWVRDGSSRLPWILLAYWDERATCTLAFQGEDPMTATRCTDADWFSQFGDCIIARYSNEAPTAPDRIEPAGDHRLPPPGGTVGED